MTSEQKPVFWKSITFGGMACATLLILGLATLSVVSGAELDFGAAATPASVIIAAFILGQRQRNGNGETPPKAGGPPVPLAGAVLLALMIPMLAGCGAMCVTEGQVVSAVDVGIESADDVLDSDADKAMDIARGVADLGRAAVTACELLRDGAGWQQWVGLALQVTTGIARRFATSTTSQTNNHADPAGDFADRPRAPRPDETISHDPSTMRGVVTATTTDGMLMASTFSSEEPPTPPPAPAAPEKPSPMANVPPALIEAIAALNRSAASGRCEAP